MLKVLGDGGEGLIYSYPDIGDKEALDYFPSLAAKFLIEAIRECGEDVELYCLSGKWNSSHSC